MNFNFKNKTILVTGGTRGIGKTIVKKLKKLNATVHYTGTSNKKILSLNNKIFYHKLDLLNLYDLEKLSNYIDNKKIKIDILINNAGINKIESFSNFKKKDINSLIDVNLRSQILISQLIIRNMVKNKIKGKIINISSIWGHLTRNKRSIYSITKHGLHGLTKSLANEFAKNGIIVNSVSPGFTKTDLTTNTNSEASLKKIIKSIPLNRLANTNEIADLIIFLTSDLNQYMTGQNIVIDGGYSIK